MKITVNYGVVWQGQDKFQADRRMLMELSSLLPEVVGLLGNNAEGMIEVFMIGPCTDLGQPKNVEVKVILAKEGDRKAEGRFVVSPADLSPSATPEQRRRNVLAPIKDFLSQELDNRIGELNRRSEVLHLISGTLGKAV